jgi:hypothetical protein
MVAHRVADNLATPETERRLVAEFRDAVLLLGGFLPYFPTYRRLFGLTESGGIGAVCA